MRRLYETEESLPSFHENLVIRHAEFLMYEYIDLKMKKLKLMKNFSALSRDVYILKLVGFEEEIKKDVKDCLQRIRRRFGNEGVIYLIHKARIYRTGRYKPVKNHYVYSSPLHSAMKEGTATGLDEGGLSQHPYFITV